MKEKITLSLDQHENARHGRRNFSAAKICDAVMERVSLCHGALA